MATDELLAIYTRTEQQNDTGTRCLVNAAVVWCINEYGIGRERFQRRKNCVCGHSTQKIRDNI